MLASRVSYARPSSPEMEHLPLVKPCKAVGLQPGRLAPSRHHGIPMTPCWVL